MYTQSQNYRNGWDHADRGEIPPFGTGQEQDGSTAGFADADTDPVDVGSDRPQWTDEAIAEANAADAQEPYEMDDLTIRQCVEPLSRCPAVSSVHVVRQHTHTFRFRTGEIPPREDVYSIGVSLRGGTHTLTGSGETLADAVLAVMRQVQVIVVAAASTKAGAACS